MGKIIEFIDNKESLKICITDYAEGQLDTVHVSKSYYFKHRGILRTQQEIKKEKHIEESEFCDRLYTYLFNQKISELLIILYLEDINGIYPTMYELNRLLRRTKDQYSATFKAIKKLEKLEIIIAKPVKDSNRKEKQVFINKKVVKIYGEDEFRQMMLNEWDSDAKEYIKRRLDWLLKEKEKFEKRMESIKQGRRVKKDGRNRYFK